MRVAILGASGHVGRLLTAELSEREDVELLLVARDTQRVRTFAARHARSGRWDAIALDQLASVRADAFISCLGSGDPGRLPDDVLGLEEKFDTLFLDAVRRNDGARGIAFSSGVVYSSDFFEPAHEGTPLRAVDSVASTPGGAYALGKVCAESRHRANPELAIVDLRLFSLYSRFVDRSARYLMNDVVDAIMSGQPVEVSPDNIIRDYVAPSDLTGLVACVLDSAPINRAFDVYSAAAASKHDILEYLGVRYGLAYTDIRMLGASPTGVKPNYFSKDHSAGSLGYQPARTSLEGLSEEIDALLELREGGGE